MDILNPIQTRAAGMEPHLLKKDFGDRLCFHGGVDEQELLPHGNKEEVQREVSMLVETLGDGGGYILCSSHFLQPDTPVENVLAMYDVAIRS